MTRVDFYRMFKQSQESWRQALKLAELKAMEYSTRCRSYLDINNQIVT